MGKTPPNRTYAEFCHSPPQHRSTRGNDRARGVLQRDAHRICQCPVFGWAFANRRNLMPTREQVSDSVEFMKREQERLRGRIRLEFVVPDYYAKYPKPCMGGWGRKLMLITPSGDALPCHAAQ